MAVDMHAHYVSPGALDAASRRGLAIRYIPSARVIEFPSGPSRPISPELTDLAARETWVNSRQLTTQVLSPWMDVIGDELPPEDERDWCRLLNDGMAADIYNNPLFRGFAALPTSNGDMAATELQRCVDDLGFVGGVMPTQVRGCDIVDAGLDPLLEAAESLNATLFVHPLRVLASDRLARDFLHNICGNPFETTIAAMKLAFSSTFDQWPRLRMLLSHCGGTLPFLAGRAKQASHSVPSVSWSITSTEEILSLFFYDSVLHDLQALSFAISRLGPRIALGTDAPFGMGIDDPLGHIRAALAVGQHDSHAADSVISYVPSLLCGE